MSSTEVVQYEMDKAILVSLIKKYEWCLQQEGAEPIGIVVLIVTGTASDEEDPQYPDAKKGYKGWGIVSIC